MPSVLGIGKGANTTMAKLPDPVHEHTTATAIVRFYEKNQESGNRPHLGASIIGKPCLRELWYSFRWATAKKFDGRILRLFETGQLAEPRFIENLRGIGVEILDRDPDTGNQFNFRAVRGHFGGSCDGIGRGFPEAPKSWAIAEFKTHNDDSFKQLKKLGVSNAKPEHFAQMQVYMGLAELERALYLAVNKNTDELHSEWIHFERDFFDRLLAKAEKVIDAEVPPEKLSTDPAWYLCKFCDHHAVCHGDRVPQKNCRTCVHATPVEDGQWGCQHHERLIPVEEQRMGCRSHLFIPPLINYAEPLDAGDGWIKYRHRDGLVFANVTEDLAKDAVPEDVEAGYVSDELVVTVPEIVGDKLTASIKQEFGGRVMSSSLTDDKDPPF
jgi:hypothetical protein